MSQKPFNPYGKLLQEAINIRYVIIAMGGMATKSCVEDVLMVRHGINRGKAHDIMNHIEFNNLDLFLIQREFSGKPPTLLDFPEIAQVDVPHLSKRMKLK